MGAGCGPEFACPDVGSNRFILNPGDQDGKVISYALAGWSDGNGEFDDVAYITGGGFGEGLCQVAGRALVASSRHDGS